MKNWKPTIFGILFLFSLVIFQASIILADTTATITVQTKSGTAVAGAIVVAAEFTDKGPGSKTQTGTSGSDGTCSLTLPDNPTGGYYYIFATAQGYSPTLNQQLNQGIPAIAASGTTQTKTITINNDLSDVGEVVLAVTSGSASGLVGSDIRRSGGNFDHPIAFGLTRLDANGSGVVRLVNVPRDSNSVKYQANAFDVSANLHSFVEFSSSIASGDQIRFILNLKGDNALPPSVYEDKVEDSGSSGDSTELSIEGVVMSTDTTNPVYIPWVGINLEAYQNGNTYGAAWSNSDDQGRFKFYGLKEGTTYFVQMHSGCARNGECFKGWHSTATSTSNPNASAPSGYDFLYTGTRLIKKFTLERVPAGSGKMGVFVRDTKGNPIPGASISVEPDYSSYHSDPPDYPIYNWDGSTNWSSTFTCESPWSRGSFDERAWHHNVDLSSPGLSAIHIETTGYSLITGLQSGNYRVRVWTRFTSDHFEFNAGEDAESTWDWHHMGCKSETKDDLRVTIDPDRTNSLGTNVFVYDVNGNDLGLSTVTVVVKLKEKTGGRLQGTLTFPEDVDLSQDPVTIFLERDCQNEQTSDCWSSGNFALVNGTGSVQSYSIDVTTGSYWMRIMSNFWGVVRQHGGDDAVKFETVGTTATKNMSFVKAGRIVGKIYRPDGSLFKPGNDASGSWVSGWASAHGENAWGGNQVSNDGSFVIGGLIPGEMRLEVEIHGSEEPWIMPDKSNLVSVTAGVDVSKDINLITGGMVLFQASTNALPSPVYSQSHWGDYRGEIWQGLRVPAGMKFDLDNISNYLFAWDKGWEDRTFRWTGGEYCEGGIHPINSWCPQWLPLGKTFDFYFMRRGDFGDDSHASNYIFFTVVNSTKNIPVDNDHDTAVITNPHDSKNSFKAVPVDLTPSDDQAATQRNSVVLFGKVNAEKFIREDQFLKLGGEESNFFRYLPIVRVEASDGGLLAAGVVTPSPQDISRMDHLDTNSNGVADFEDAITTGDWELFKTVLSTLTSTWGYEIRGLPAGKEVAITVTTPNYPPAKTIKTLNSVAGSTTTVSFDLDAAGPGAVITGVVATTDAVKLANATVLLEAKDFQSRSVLSSSTGVYRFEGLPEGIYKLSVTASGYEAQAAKQIVVSTDTSEGTVYSGVNFSLPVAGDAVIYGKVYTEGFLYNTMQSDVKVVAYNDSANQRNVSGSLTVVKAVTNSTGTYVLSGLIAGDYYKLTFKKDDYRVYQTTVVAAAGATVVDVALEKKPLDLEIEAWKDFKENKYKFLIKNPSSFKEGQAWIGQDPMTSTATAVAEVTDDFVQTSENLTLSYPAGVIDLTRVDWVLYIVAISYDGEKITKTVVFGPGSEATKVASLDDCLGGDDDEDDSGQKANEIPLGSDSKAAIVIPAGAISKAGDNTDPKMTFAQQSTGTLDGAEFFGDAYQLDFENIQFTGKCIEMTLSYDTTTAGGDAPVVIYYDPTTDKWVAVDGDVTYNVDEGIVTACVDFTELGGYAQTSTLTTLGRKPNASMRAMAGNGYFAYNPMNSSEGSGLFSVGIVAQASGGVSATKYVAYNFPNPFNLKSKSVGLRSGSSGVATTITGTYIVVAPTGSGSVNVGIKIFNLAGDLVREIAETATAAQYNYFHWDGKNDSGQYVASGVYFAVIDAPGAPSKEPIKMVVTK